MFNEEYLDCSQKTAIVVRGDVCFSTLFDYFKNYKETLN